MCEQFSAAEKKELHRAFGVEELTLDKWAIFLISEHPKLLETVDQAMMVLEVCSAGYPTLSPSEKDHMAIELSSKACMPSMGGVEAFSRAVGPSRGGGGGRGGRGPARGGAQSDAQSVLRLRKPHECYFADAKAAVEHALASHVPVVATKALVLLPTRELAQQCLSMLESLAKFTFVTSALCVGAYVSME